MNSPNPQDTSGSRVLREVLGAIILGFAGISLLQAYSAYRLLFWKRYPWQAPREAGDDVIWVCGNAISDPLVILLNLGAPAGASAAVCLLKERKGRRWLEGATALAVIWGVTTAGLLAEAWCLRPFGLDVIPSVWWLPWRWGFPWRRPGW